ncbi:MAG TPA: methyltransferase domain-containing protein [Dehalococcoidales bacterium]|nr:methyltransferase domain-containing protein [Dehalococcoidales bacterium]
MVIRAYFNQQADTWDELIAEKDTGKLERMAKRLDLEPGSTLLDVGTGTGVFLPYLLAMIGRNGRVVGLDIAARMLSRACDKGFHGEAQYICGDVMAVPCPDAMFDAVVCYSSFPHFQDKPRAFHEIHRVLKDGGRLLICHTASRARINEIHHQKPVVSHDLIPEADEVREMLLAAGFTEIRIADEDDSYLASAMRP